MNPEWFQKSVVTLDHKKLDKKLEKRNKTEAIVKEIGPFIIEKSKP